MDENNHTFTFISPYGAIVEVEGHQYTTKWNEMQIVQYAVTQRDGDEIAIIPGNWLFVRVSEQYKVHSG